jgi:peptidoglycan hydrolase-like protein with peptidoglycan-binding domain
MRRHIPSPDRHNGRVRRAFATIAAVMLAGGVLVATDDPAPTDANGGIYELGYCPVDGGIAPKDTGPGVMCLQFALAVQGLYSGDLTGEYDAATVDAVKFFQALNPPLTSDGVAKKDTLLQLGVFSGVDNTPPAACLADAPLQIGTRGEDVICLQTVLFDQGLLPFSPTGVFDNDTALALQALQATYPGLQTNGIGDQRTLAAMNIWSGVSVTGNVSAGQAPAGPWPAPVQPEYPEWRTTADGLPLFGNRRACNRVQADVIAAEFAKDGADISTQQWAVYVATREGGCDHTTVNFNLQTRDDSHCTFQLNAMAGMFNANASLGRHGWTVDNVKESLQNCADAASDLWVFCGRAPWTPPKYGCTPPWEGDLGAVGDA